MMHRLSMRASLALAILAMGLVGMSLAMIAGRVYRQLALDAQQAALASLVRVKVQDMLERLREESTELVVYAERMPGFDGAAAGHRASRLQPLLHRLLVVDPARSTALHLQGAAVYDLHGRPIAQALRPGAPDPASCARLSGPPPALPSGLCLAGGRLEYLLTAPLGRPAAGYLQFLVDPLPNFATAERDLGMPLRVGVPGGAAAYRSARWPGPSADTLVAGYAEPLTGSGRVVEVSVARNIDRLQRRLTRTEYVVMAAAAATTLLAVLIALAVLRKTAILPLQLLARQLRNVRRDKRYLGERVQVRGNREVRELGEGFNEMTTRLKALYESLEHMAFTDSLTQLPNRALFHDRLQQAILAARREQRAFAILMMDLDRFKDINDTLGHHIGDKVLQEVGERLRGKLRESDTVARMGGDEFAVLLPAVNSQYVATAARMLLKAVQVSFEIDGHRLLAGASIGIALFPDHGDNANTLMQRADVAMYAAKKAGGGHAFYEPGLDEHSPARLALTGELRQAVDKEEFALHYQPKVSLVTGEVIGAEALLRWQHPRERLMSPDQFLPLLEQTGLITSVTPWVLNEALRQCRRWHSDGLDLSVSVNLSMRDLQEPYLVEMLAELLASTGVDARWLELEITENSVMTDAARTLGVLSRLAGMGLSLSIDDFGTGYSSLAYLKRLPVDLVKIDKSFVMDMARDDNDATIVRASIDLAHNMGLKVVAEGVESDAIVRMLTALECDAAQGTHVSPPLPADQLRAWLQSSSWALRRLG